MDAARAREMLTASGFDAPDVLRLSRDYPEELVVAVCAYAQRSHLGPGWIVNRLRSGEMPPAARPVQQAANGDWGRFQRWLDKHVPEHANRSFAWRIIWWSEADLRNGRVTGAEVAQKIRDIAAQVDGGEQLSLLDGYPRPVDDAA